MFLSTLLALAAAQHSAYYEPQHMVVVARADSDDSIWDLPIEVCGHVVSAPDRRNEVTMYGGGRFLKVEVGTDQRLRSLGPTCVLGVIRRRDGLSFRTARERNMPASHVSHTYNPDFLLRRCTDRISCERLVPRD